MIHSVGSRSTKGGLSQAIHYALGERDHNGTIREAVNIISGNPDVLIELEKNMNTKHTYIHTSLSFTPEESEMLNNNPDALDRILESYKQQMAAGLPNTDTSRLPMLAVRHDEKNSFHIHFITLRQDLETQKTYQPFVKQRGDVQRFNDWNATMQKEHGLENPNSAEHQRSAGWSKNLPEQAKDIRNEIDRVINEEIAQGNLTNRKDIIDFINKTNGMKVARIIPSAISIKVDGQKRNIRLQGSVYNEHFTGIEKLSSIVEERAKVDYAGAEQRLQAAMSKLAERSYKYVKEDNQMVGLDTDSRQPSAISKYTGRDLVSIPRNDGQIQNARRRLSLDEDYKNRDGQQRSSLGTDKREIKTPEHRIFNGVEYNKNKQAWLWQGAYGYAQVTATEEGYSISHGNKMEWQMAAQLLKEDGASHVSLTCSNEQSMMRAIQAHADAGLKISSVKLNGIDMPLNEIKEMVNHYDDTTKITRTQLTGGRAKQEGQTSEYLDAIQQTDEHRNKRIERQVDNLVQSSEQLDKFINGIDSELEQQRYEDEQEYESTLSL